MNGQWERRPSPTPKLAAFSTWFEEFLADQWDRQIEADIRAGRLDEAARRNLAQRREQRESERT